MLFDITGKNAPVAGASRGLGLGIARGFAKAGANLALVSRQMPDAVMEEPAGYGVKATFYPFGLSCPSAIPKLVDGIFGEREAHRCENPRRKMG